MLPQLMGQRGPSMFPGIGQGQGFGPDPETIENERQRVLARKQVRVKGHHVKVFNMHTAADVAAYEKLMQTLIKGAQAQTHMIWDNEKQLVTKGGNQEWLRYLEWTEFELNVETTLPVGTSKPRR